MKIADQGHSGEAIILTRSQIHEILPHGEPFMFLESITSLEPGKRVTGRLADLTSIGRRDWVDAHFPNNPVVPGVILTEALAQLGAVAIMSMPEYRSKYIMLGGVKRMRFRRPAIPGHTVILEAELTRMRGIFGEGHARALDEQGAVLAEGDITFAMLNGPGEGA